MLSPAVADGELGIEGYLFVRQDRNSHEGGVAVYFRDSFPISRVQFRFDFENSDSVQNDTPETLFIEFFGSQKRTILGCVYRPPSAPVASWSRLSDLVDSVISTHVSEKTELQLVLTRDFNVDVLDEEHPHFRITSTFWPPLTSWTMFINQPGMVKQNEVVLTYCWQTKLRLCTRVHLFPRLWKLIMDLLLLISSLPNRPLHLLYNHPIETSKTSMSLCSVMTFRTKTLQHSRMERMSIRCGLNGSRNLPKS